MDTVNILVPGAGESITEVLLAALLVADGAYVAINQEIAEIDSEKATLSVSAPVSGNISFKAKQGQTIKVGSVLAIIDTSAAAPPPDLYDRIVITDKVQENPVIEDAPVRHFQVHQEGRGKEITEQGVVFTPQALKALDEQGICIETLISSAQGNRITKKDVLLALSALGKQKASDNSLRMPAFGHKEAERLVEEIPMTPLRKKLAERLVSVKNQTAMLTTFNEIDMSAVIKLRNDNQKAFQEKYGVKLGFMSLFAKAATTSIPFFPLVNAAIDGDVIKSYKYTDLGIAVSTPKGLMVPVVRNAQGLSIAELEIEISRLGEKARNGKISPDDLMGGTFSITNGGIFGSMLSTPIINPPQAAILGMHNIVERPVVVDGQIVIRPIMYVALSYDHRVIDGRESVGFLKKIKECIEHPELLLSQGKAFASSLLGLS